MNTTKEAKRDAEEYARARMFYGDGAGTRRKLIMASVNAKATKDPAYRHAFQVELGRQDMAEHAAKARRERKVKDTTKVVNKNTKALLSGNTNNLSTGILVVGTVAYFAHKTGFDKYALEKSKKLAANVKQRWHEHKARQVVHNITSVGD